MNVPIRRGRLQSGDLNAPIPATPFLSSTQDRPKEAHHCVYITLNIPVVGKVIGVGVGGSDPIIRIVLWINKSHNDQEVGESGSVYLRGWGGDGQNQSSVMGSADYANKDWDETMSRMKGSTSRFYGTSTVQEEEEEEEEEVSLRFLRSLSLSLSRSPPSPLSLHLSLSLPPSLSVPPCPPLSPPSPLSLPPSPYLCPSPSLSPCPSFSVPPWPLPPSLSLSLSLSIYAFAPPGLPCTASIATVSDGLQLW